jgi:transcriptional regulator with XRE-family HTH domain
MLEISKKFGKTVREIRLQKKLSQGDVAKRLNLHRSYVSGIERGIRNPSLKVIERFAKALGVEAKSLIK